MKSETNLSDDYRRNILKITSSLSVFCKNKPFKSMTRLDDVLSYLDTLRKPESRGFNAQVDWHLQLIQYHINLIF